MTKVTVLGQEPKQKKLKPIEFTHVLMVNCKSFNFGRKHADEIISPPSEFTSITLIVNKSDGHEFDIFLCTKASEKYIVFGHFNDGVVE